MDGVAWHMDGVAWHMDGVAWHMDGVHSKKISVELYHRMHVQFCCMETLVNLSLSVQNTMSISQPLAHS
jgi:hypothetical protein